jgi:hypothetical protein
MNNRNILTLLILFAASLVILGCGGGGGGASPSAINYGSLTISLELTQDSSNSAINRNDIGDSRDIQSNQKENVCNSGNIEVIRAYLRNEAGSTVTAQQWLCSGNLYTITEIPTGDNYRLQVEGMSGGFITYRTDELTGLSINANATTNAGTQVMKRMTTPVPTTMDTSTVPSSTTIGPTTTVIPTTASTTAQSSVATSVTSTLTTTVATTVATTSTTTVASSSYSAQDWRNLQNYNDPANDGYTVRWPGAIQAYALENSQQYFQRWTDATSGKVTFNFVSNQPSDGIRSYVSSSLGPGTAGQTVTYYNPGSGRIVEAEIIIDTDAWNSAKGSAVYAHEIGHAIGFFGHTNDGGLMDPTTASADVITAFVSRILTHLYSYPPHTDMSIYASRVADAKFESIKQPDGTVIYRTPRDEFYIKPMNDGTIAISNGPFPEGSRAALPYLR